MKKSLLFLTILTLLFVASLHRLSFVSAQYAIDSDNAETQPAFQTSSFRDSTYYRTLRGWLEQTTYAVLAETRIPFAWIENTTLSADTDVNYPLGYVATIDEGEAVQYRFSVPTDGLYELGVDFRMPELFYTVPSLFVTIDGESLFNEMTALELPVEWEIVELDESLRYNRYGNELLPKSVSLNAWNKAFLSDNAGYAVGNYQFLLEAGEHVVRFTALDLSVTFGSLYVQGKDVVPTKAEYVASTANLPSDSSGELIVIEGQDFITKNDLEIKSSYYKESAMTPYSYRNSVLNQLDGDSMARGGTEVTYQFNVAKAGYYQLGLKALKDTYLGVMSGKTFRLDGEVPFAALEAYEFGSSRQWQNITLGDESGSYSFYLTAGTHTLSIASTISHYMTTIDRINAIMDDISAISLKVQTITGGNADDALDWNLLKYIPDLQERLRGYAAELVAMYDALDERDASLASAPELSTLNVAAKQLLRVAKNPNKLGSKLQEFSEGSGSAYQLLGATVSALLNQPLSIDKLYFYQDVELPRANGSFFTKLWHGIKSFFYSFFDARYNNNDIEAGTLEVWVSQSSLYLDIIQSMIDTDFTQATGIPVKCSIMQNTSKIVMSNATDANPDVVLSVDTWIPYGFALRGMLEDLSQYEGFEEMTDEYIANNFTTLIHENGVYGIPETQSVFLMFYRKDILDYLGLDIPNTWDDVIDMLPILQSHQLNFFHPLGGDSAYKGYGYTASLIYQFGGEIYSENGVESTLKDPKTIRAVQFMTDLFTVYDLPLQVSSFFEHFRSGDMPLGIASIDMYLQLKYAAPELAGQWGIAPIPGVVEESTGKVLRYATSYGKTSILFANSEMKEEGWDLIRWWNSASTQTEFMQYVKTSLGERYLQISANMLALQSSVWDESIKAEIIEQAKWGRLPAVTPGSYIVERELSNIWNKVVIDLTNVMVAINESIPLISRELNRKFSEFGYQTSTDSTGKVFLVPMNSTIDTWIKGGGYHDEDDLD